MENKKSYFDSLVSLHDEIRLFKAEQSGIILKNYKGERGKFNRTCTPSDRKNLSSTAICTYTIVQYSKLWNEGEAFGFGKSFDSIEDYWNHIIGILGNEKILRMDIEAPDEFTILNVTSLLSKMLEKKGIQAGDTEKIFEIIEALCLEFIKNQFVFRERGIHPFLYYKLLIILQDWQKILPQLLKDRIAETLIKKYGIQVSEKYPNKNGENDWVFDWFFDRIYDNGKYEMYRQIALYYANDKTLFDVKRLVYSLLIVTLQGKYSNNLVIKKALEIIFDEQLDTGLLPISHVVDNDFVMINAKIEPREVSAVPMLLSFECFTDMLSVDELK